MSSFSIGDIIITTDKYVNPKQVGKIVNISDGKDIEYYHVQLEYNRLPVTVFPREMRHITKLERALL